MLEAAKSLLLILSAIFPIHPLTILTALIGFALIVLNIFLCYGFSDRLARTLGRTGMTVVTKLSAFLLVCIGCRSGGTVSRSCWSRWRCM
jgi:small neutral amino acid transporter SnatA (MarC family)